MDAEALGFQRKFHDYKGLDLLVFQQDHENDRYEVVVKTRYIVMLQGRIRQFIGDRRRDKLNKYLLRMFSTCLCDDVLTNIAKFIV